MKFFHPHIPKSTIARPEIEKHIGKMCRSVGENDDPYESKNSDPSIIYNINSYGYRGFTYKDQYDHVILNFGTSFTFGIGIREDQTYPSVVESLTGIPSLNFGIPGGSVDTSARMIACVVPYFKQISDRVTVTVPYVHPIRREIILDNYSASINAHTEPPTKDFFNLIDDTSNTYNIEKNTILIRSLCCILDTKLIELDTSKWEDKESWPDTNRQGISPGPKWCYNIAEEIQDKIILDK